MVHHVAGWLIQDRYELDAEADKVVDTPDEMGRERRVIPGICAEGYGWAVVAIDENLEGGGEENWVVLAPGEAEPTAEAQEAEAKRRADAAAKKAQA
ncbi:hypothetical protein DLE60_31835 [Micromonospora globispora]|uniref:Uncharacterized protein n=1 Tax=Micromonospora globispora TaxID=1450148 RepID=A0A317K278_9ACTN|nr:hypothetical protein DLJ46_15995 [Micromonospora globispora]PWU52060.1 hypothetical protein DLE60_31835 [Micromonospora globispora]RQX04104.1 hypothetical protein DKL51_03560 [Micromonospora globispora]